MKGPAEIREAKRSLRRELRAARRSLDGAARARNAESLVSRAAEIEPLQAARAVAGYLASDGELDIAPLLGALRTRGARVFLPRSRPDGSIVLAQANETTMLRPTGPGGTLEPDAHEASLAEIGGPAAILVPCVAVDHAGQRLGRGGGGYDRLLPQVRRLGWSIVGVCHSPHFLERIPVEVHDQPVDAVLTELAFTWLKDQPK
jgi:5-formyltetrahydrofolate cyclo-ligase